MRAKQRFASDVRHWCSVSSQGEAWLANDRQDLANLASRLWPAVLAAARLEMRHLQAGVTVERKTDQSPVTVADREAEAILVNALTAAEPGTPIIAEEAVAAGIVPEIGDRFFLVDALDGTRSFIAGEPDFTINIARIENRRPTFGIIYAPASGRLFAGLGPSAALEADVPPDGATDQFDRLPLRAIRTRVPDRNALTAVASRSHNLPAVDDFLTKWGIAERRNIGSSLKFCLVARGEADLYPRFGAINEWDTAAGDAILSAAGGIVTTPDGAELLYGKANNLFKNSHFIAWGRRELATVMT